MAKIRELIADCHKCDFESHHGVSHVQATDYTLSKAVSCERTRVTNLSEDDEDTLRLALASLFALSPEDLLLVQHVMTGRNLASFGQRMVRLAADLKVTTAGWAEDRKRTSRSRDSIVRRMPELKPLFDAVFHARTRDGTRPW